MISGGLNAQLAYALTITFDSVPSSGNPIVTSVTTQGFTFASGHFHTVDSPTGVGGADNGSPVYIAEEAGSLGLPITMTESGGTPFSLNTFDGAEGFISAPSGFPNATAISVVGTLFGGGTVSALFALDGVIDGVGGAPDFQAFLLPGTFVNLTAVTFSGLIGTTGTGGLSLDNIAVNQTAPVPEPSTIVLLIPALAALGLIRRRKRA